MAAIKFSRPWAAPTVVWGDDGAHGRFNNNSGHLAEITR